MPLNIIFTFQKLARDIIWTRRRIINSKMIGSFKQIKILFDQIEVFHSFFISRRVFERLEKYIPNHVLC